MGTPWARVVFRWGDDCRVDLVLGGPDAPGLAVVEGLARLELVARRSGGAMFLQDVAPELDGLLDLVGLRREIGGHAVATDGLRFTPPTPPP